MNDTERKERRRASLTRSRKKWRSSPDNRERENAANCERQKARYDSLKDDPAFKAKSRDKAKHHNKRRRSDPELAEREREANRLRMATLRSDPQYRAKTVEQVRELRRQRRLDRELEHFLETTGGNIDEED